MVECPIRRPKDEGTLAIWRVGRIAYRYARRKERHEAECCQAGEDAMLAAYSQLTRDEAARHIVNAVAWRACIITSGCIAAFRAESGSGRRIIVASGASGIRDTRMCEGQGTYGSVLQRRMVRPLALVPEIGA